MKNGFKNALPEAPAGLADRIIMRIETERRKRLVRKMWVSGSAFAGSISLAAYGWLETAAQASHSGFFVFTSLFFSDFGAALGNFSDFALSIAESFPVFAVAVLLSGVFFAVWSAARFVDEAGSLRHPLGSRA